MIERSELSLWVWIRLNMRRRLHSTNGSFCGTRQLFYTRKKNTITKWDRDPLTFKQHGTLCHDLPSTLHFSSSGCNQVIRKFWQIVFFAAPKIQSIFWLKLSVLIKWFVGNTYILCFEFLDDFQKKIKNDQKIQNKKFTCCQRIML
jgi:hypothetical protein